MIRRETEVPSAAEASPYSRRRLADAVTASVGWADLMRRLGMTPSGGQRRVLQEKVRGLGLDTSHFKQRSPWRKYPDEAIAAAVASSTSLREVVVALGAAPATGTMSHIARRIAAAGIDTSHFPAMNRPPLDLPFTRQEPADAAATSHSVRGLARALGVPDDSRSRAALGRMLGEHGISTVHFRYARTHLPEEELRKAMAASSSYADVMRALGLPVDDSHHRRVRRRVIRLGLETGHFKRRGWASRPAGHRAPVSARVLVVLPDNAGRTGRARLHRALQELGVPYRCAACGNEGEWRGRPLTLHIDHVSGNWRDNRAENLRYLCPNCHALTDTWCRNSGAYRSSGEQVSP